MPHPQIAADNAPSLTAVLFGLSGCLVDFGSMAHADTIPTDEALATPGALNILQWLNSQGTPCAWLDELPPPSPRRWPPSCRTGSKAPALRPHPGRRPMPAGKP